MGLGDLGNVVIILIIFMFLHLIIAKYRNINYKK